MSAGALKIALHRAVLSATASASPVTSFTLTSIKRLLGLYVTEWREQEERLEREAAEAAATFKYRTRAETFGKSQEEEENEEVQALFPDHTLDFSDIVGFQPIAPGEKKLSGEQIDAMEAAARSKAEAAASKAATEIHLAIEDDDLIALVRLHHEVFTRYHLAAPAAELPSDSLSGLARMSFDVYALAFKGRRLVPSISSVVFSVLSGVWL